MFGKVGQAFSSHTGTPSDCALSSLEPASVPATTKLVFFDTLPETGAQRLQALLGDIAGELGQGCQ